MYVNDLPIFSTYRLLLTLWLTTALLSSFCLLGQEATESDTVFLSEVEVVAKSREVYPLVKIDSKEFTITAQRDLGDFLRREPNVAGIRKGGVAIDPVVRGFKYSQVTVLLNGGVKIEGGCPNRMDPVAAHVESENIRAVEVIKGPYVLKYGPVLGALVNLQTNQPQPSEKPSLHGEFRYGFESNWNGQREHLAVWGGNPRIFFHASAGYKGYGSYTAGNEVLFNTSFSKKYVTASAGFIPASHHKVVISYAYDEGKNIKFPALPMDERLDQTHVGSVNYTAHSLGKVVTNLEFQGYFSPVHHVMDNRDRSTAKTMLATTTVDAWNAGGKFTGNLSAGRHKILAGLDFEHVFKDGDKEMQMKMIMGGDTFVSVKHANVWLNATTSKPDCLLNTLHR